MGHLHRTAPDLIARDVGPLDGHGAAACAAEVRDARLHDARHTAATLLLVQGVDARTVMDLLGWSHIATTRRYQHVGELRTEAARRVGAALWPEPDAKSMPATARSRSRSSARVRGES